MGDLLFAPFAARASVAVAAADMAHPQPLPERERLWRRLWIEAPGIGWHRLQLLNQRFGGLEQAWAANPSQLKEALAGSRWGPKGLEALLGYREELGPQPISTSPSAAERRRWRGRRCLVWGDAALPSSLQQLERPPLELHWQGDGRLWPSLRRREAVAVVGTRHPSRHGEAMARQIGTALAAAGWPVVSGLAEGIDAAAHQGCLEARGRPVAVLGTPLERVYPRHHGALQQQVAEQGLLVRELAPGTAVQAGHFAARNRLLVALARAVVLVECPSRSGALHSAELAWAGGTPLWAVPADTTRASAAGSNRWLARGATALLEPEDLINSIGTGPLRVTPQGGSAGELAQREAALLAAVGHGASLEQLCWKLRQGPDHLGRRLLTLELAGLLRSEPGLWWRPC